MGFKQELLEHGGGIVVFGRITLKQLAGGQHHLIGGLAATAAATHAVGHDAQQAPVGPRMRHQGNLILLVFTITPVDARGSRQAIALADHVRVGYFDIKPLLWASCNVGSPVQGVVGRVDRDFGDTKGQSFMNENLHSDLRRLIDMRIEHADLDALIDRAQIAPEPDDLMLRRLKKRRLALRDQMARLERLIEPKTPA